MRANPQTARQSTGVNDFVMLAIDTGGEQTTKSCCHGPLNRKIEGQEGSR
jgi:hypothetical protein